MNTVDYQLNEFIFHVFSHLDLRHAALMMTFQKGFLLLDPALEMPLRVSTTSKSRVVVSIEREYRT